jgi:hypothetical protein
VVEELLGDLGVMFAEDAADEGKLVLDFFEVGFRKALFAVRDAFEPRSRRRPEARASVVSTIGGIRADLTKPYARWRCARSDADAATADSAHTRLRRKTARRRHTTREFAGDLRDHVALGGRKA